ncbi:hypothetical protein HK102_013604 [Quaeritorhiza haematococci]|nr:hypothetical protein HK102_013604 [Quaeritorhiza haematococci]
MLVLIPPTLIQIQLPDVGCGDTTARKQGVGASSHGSAGTAFVGVTTTMAVHEEGEQPEMRFTGISAAEDDDGSSGGNQGKNQVSEREFIYETVVDEQMTIVNSFRCGEASGVPVSGAPTYSTYVVASVRAWKDMGKGQPVTIERHRFHREL